MITTKKFVTSGIMVLFALALTLLYIPDGIASVYAEEETSGLLTELAAFAMNGIMCIGAWMLAIKASCTGARIVRIVSIIKQWVGWSGIAGLALMLFLGLDGLGGFETTEYTELNLLMAAVYALTVISVAYVVVEIFVSRNISRMMKDIMYRMSGGRPYGYLVTLDNWSVAGLVICCLEALVVLGAFIVIGRLHSVYGIRINNLQELGLDYGTVISVVFISCAQVFSYIVFIKLARGFCEYVEQDNAEKDNAEKDAADIAAKNIGEEQE